MNLGISISIGFCLRPSDDSIVYQYMYQVAKLLGRTRKAQFGRHRFEYAILLKDDPYDWLEYPFDVEFGVDEYIAKRAKELAKDIFRGGAPESGHIFVYGDLVPEIFWDFIALHEYVEARGGSHRLACFVELSAVRRTNLYPDYAHFLHFLALNSQKKKKSDSGYVKRAIPTFDYDPRRFTSLEYIEIFYEELELLHDSKSQKQLRAILDR